MFQLINTFSNNIINNSIGYYKVDYSILLDNGTYELIPLEIQKCELGKK